jgi:hypothetical protein
MLIVAEYHRGNKDDRLSNLVECLRGEGQPVANENGVDKKLLCGGAAGLIHAMQGWQAFLK